MLSCVEKRQRYYDKLCAVAHNNSTNTRAFCKHGGLFWLHINNATTKKNGIYCREPKSISGVIFSLSSPKVIYSSSSLEQSSMYFRWRRGGLDVISHALDTASQPWESLFHRVSDVYCFCQTYPPESYTSRHSWPVLSTVNTRLYMTIGILASGRE